MSLSKNRERVMFCMEQDRERIKSRLRGSIRWMREKMDDVERNLNAGETVGGSFSTITEQLHDSIGAWDAIHRAMALLEAENEEEGT